MPFCKNCGHETAPDDKFCLNCGTPTEEIGEENLNVMAVKSEPKQENNSIKIVPVAPIKEDRPIVQQGYNQLKADDVNQMKGWNLIPPLGADSTTKVMATKHSRKTIAIIASAAGAIVLIGIILALIFVPSVIKKNNFNKFYTEAEKYVTLEKYEEAFDSINNAAKTGYNYENTKFEEERDKIKEILVAQYADKMVVALNEMNFKSGKEYLEKINAVDPNNENYDLMTFAIDYVENVYDRMVKYGLGVDFPTQYDDDSMKELESIPEIIDILEVVISEGLDENSRNTKEENIDIDAIDESINDIFSSYREKEGVPEETTPIPESHEENFEAEVPFIEEPKVDDLLSLEEAQNTVCIYVEQMWSGYEIYYEVQEYEDSFVFGARAKNVETTSDLLGWYKIDRKTGIIYDAITGEQLVYG